MTTAIGEVAARTRSTQATAASSPASMTLPSFMRTMRSAAAATSSSWVTIRIVWPPWWRRRNSSITSWPPSESRAPVGSSASRRVGSLARARAMARRWRCPPESEPGAALALSDRPSRSSRSRPRVSAGLRFEPGDHRRQGHVLEHGHALEQVEELEDDPDVRAAHAGQLVLGLAGDLLVGEHDRALVGLVEAGDEVEQRRLAAARRSHDGDELAAVASGSRRRAAPAPGRSRPRRCGARPARRAPGPCRATGAVGEGSVVVMSGSRCLVRSDRW